MYTHDSELQALKNAIADLHISLITTPSAKPFPAYFFFTSRLLVTASNIGDYATFRSQVLPSPTPIRIACQLSRLSLVITFRHEPHRKYRFHSYRPTTHRLSLAYSLPLEHVFIKPLSRNFSGVFAFLAVILLQQVSTLKYLTA
jgi:hypothetical protein